MEKGKGEDPLIEAALELLEEAERDHAEAHALGAEADALDAKADIETLEAERDLEKAKGCDGEEGNNDATVRFRHLAEHEKVKFSVDEDMTLQAIWDQAYGELEIARDARDVLQAPIKGGNPVSLMEHLALTLKQARNRDLCKRDFEIAARTGGA